MSFLNSAFLLALAAVSIPLIIHFLSKRRIKTIEFSSLKFLEQMQKSRMRWLKIKELLLLVLRMIIIALIVMAFARPTLRGFAGSSRASSSVAMIIDRSASMEAEGETGSVFDEVRRMAGGLIDILDPGDMATVISFPESGSPTVFGPFNPGDNLKRHLNDIEPGYQAGNTGKALQAALEILKKSPDLNREIYIFSDHQRGNWNNLPPDLLQRESWDGIHIFSVSAHPTGADNVGITDIIYPPQILMPGESFDLEAELVNYGRGTLQNILVGVVVDDERKAQASVSLPPDHPSRVGVTFKLDSPGDHGGYVEIDYDRYGLDNRRYFSLHVARKINLLAVGQTENSLKLLNLVLDRQEAGQIDYKGIGATDLLRENLGDYNVILLYDLPNLDPAREAAIERFVSGGGGLLVSLGKSSSTSYWGDFLTEKAGISPGELTGKPDEYIIWDNFDFEHPIFSPYSADEKDRSRPTVPDIHINYYRNLQGGRAIGSSSSGINLLVESETESILVFSSGLDLLTGDIPAHSFFVPFLVRSVEYLGSREAAGGFEGIIGQLSSWNIKGDVIGGLKLISPTGTAEDLLPAQTTTGSLVSFTEYGPPGIYALESGKDTLSLMAFNVDRAESSAETIEPEEIGELLGADVRSIEPGADMKTSIKEARFGRELWKEFLLAALILLIIESLIGKTSPPKRAEA
jgi:hypothetical protein